MHKATPIDSIQTCVEKIAFAGTRIVAEEPHPPKPAVGFRTSGSRSKSIMYVVMLLCVCICTCSATDADDPVAATDKAAAPAKSDETSFMVLLLVLLLVVAAMISTKVERRRFGRNKHAKKQTNNEQHDINTLPQLSAVGR